MESKKSICLLLLILICLLSYPAPALSQGPIAATPDPRFGVVEAYLNAAEATAAGAGYTRIILRWDVIQPDGRDDWKPANVPDPFIAAELQAGREVVAVLVGTPSWASYEVNSAKAVPDLEAWGNFTKRIAQQYQGRIKHWVIWNEPDVWDPAHPGNTWLGTEEDYFALLKSAYGNIKSVDPTMQVHLTGLTYHWDAQHDREQYLSRLLRIITADPAAADNNYYFDAAVYHLYYDPKQIFSIMSEIRGILDSYGLGHKPIWVNETNAPPTNDPQEPPWAEPLLVVSSQEQAAFVIQAYALLIAAGAERVEIYKMKNSTEHPEDIEPFGLLRGDDSRRPAFNAYQVVTKHFSGYTNADWFREGDVYVVTLDRNGQTTTVLWNLATQEQTFTLNAIAPEALLVDEMGNEQVIAAENGGYTLTLPGATCSAGWCFIDGAPRVLVENGSPDQRTALIPAATETPTPALLPTETPTIVPTATPEPTATATEALAPEPEVATPVAVANEAAPMPPTATPVPAAPQVANAEAPAQPAQAALLEAPQPAAAPISTTPDIAAIFTPSRILLLIVIGVILFTVFYFIQFRVWTKRGNR